MLNDEKRGTPPPVDRTPTVPGQPAAADAPGDAIAAGATYSGGEVRRLVAEAEARGRKAGHDSAWAESRRTFDKALAARLATKTAELEARYAAERAALIEEVARETAARLKGTD